MHTRMYIAIFTFVRWTLMYECGVVCVGLGQCLAMVHRKNTKQLIPIVNRPWDKSGPIISYYFDVWCRNHIDNTHQRTASTRKSARVCGHYRVHIRDISNSHTGKSMLVYVRN